MTKSDDKRVPVLRFKGFTDDWEQRKLGDIAKTYSGGTPSVTNKNFYNNGYIPFIKSGEIGSSKTEQKINNDGLNNSSAKLVKTGTLLYALYGATSGKAAISPINGAINQAVLAIIPQTNVNRFIYEWLNKNKPRITEKYLQGGQGNLSAKIIKQINIFTTSKNEELKISDILGIVEKIISLQQRKVNDLNSMKSALLQDVFPNTQGIKKIKLSTQEWNLKKISSIFKERNQRNKNGMLLSVSISKGIYPFSENDRKDNSSNDKSNYKEVKINDLAYNSMRMWQGAVGVSKYNGIVSPAYTVITPKKEENPNFYYYYFKNKRMLFNFRQHSQGLTSDTWNLKFPLFEKILIQVPSDKEEEQRVSSLFKQIDKSIELSKIQIKKLTSIKQFLLQNMFI